MTDAPAIEAFFDRDTYTVSYLVADPGTGLAAVIDPVLDFDPASGEIRSTSADRIMGLARDRGWRIAMVLETHVHADHLTAAHYIRAATGAWVGIGEHVRDVQQTFRPVFALHDLEPDGADFDRLFADGARVPLGALEIEVMHTPGHTSACVSYRIGDAVLVGDTLFMPDYGTARTDFPGGDARTLYRSIRRILSLPDETRLFVCHDYKAPGRDEFAWETTVAAERRHNLHVHDGVGEDEFVAMRTARDATLAAPRLLLPSIQVNIRAGRLPDPAESGARFLVIPLKLRMEAEAALDA